MLSVGSRVGEYEIVAQLRAGGMATLFLGRRTGVAGFARHVAIKVVHPHLTSDPAFVRMFVDEALLSARIHNPNVVHVEELGQTGDTYFLVMEYVHGVSLAQLLAGLARRTLRLSPALATHIALHVAEGLHAAHETRGDDGTPLDVVHRDVSPQNILLAFSGHVKLIDFGIAKAHGRGQHTTAGSLKGKIRYMSPEQARGASVDRRTDVYALGIVLWEMLTQRRLFNADNDLALLDEVRSPHARPPGSVVPDISPALDAVVMATLAPDATARPATAHDLRRRLAEAMPAGLAIDASDLASVLSDVMAEERRAGLAALPAQTASQILTMLEPSPAAGDSNATQEPKRQSLSTLTLDAGAFAETKTLEGQRSIATPQVTLGHGPPGGRARGTILMRRVVIAAVIVSVLGAAIAAFVFGSSGGPGSSVVISPQRAALVEAGPDRRELPVVTASVDAGTALDAAVDATADSSPNREAEARRRPRPPRTSKRPPSKLPFVPTL